jgi:hypothetical protein
MELSVVRRKMTLPSGLKTVNAPGLSGGRGFCFANITVSALT